MSWLIRVDTVTGSVKKEPVLEQYRLAGGRSLIARILNEEVDPACEPLGPRNKFIVCPGILGGTSASSSGRISVGGKSPLTGGIKEANAGGTVGHRLSRYGIKAIILENAPEKPECKILVIRPHSITLEAADSLAGLGNYALFERLRSIYGEQVAILSTGPAGERGYANSTVAVSDMQGKPTRHAARGGLGAVMASKGVKAIVVDELGNGRLEMIDPETFKKASAALSKALRDNPVTGKALPSFGTAVLVNMVNAIGTFPTRNYSAGTSERAERISGEKLAELQKTRGGTVRHACQPGCVIRCSNIYNDANGNYLTSGLEYETIGMLGGNCGVLDLDAIAQLDRLCDDFGLDTIETGGTIGLAMELGLANFGDPTEQRKLVEEIMQGTYLGKILGQGAAVTGRVLGAKRVPVVKGQSLAAYDPRALKGTGVTYATSPMGADHTAGNTLGNPMVDPLKKEGQVALSRDLQALMATMDSLGLCIFVFFCFDKQENMQYLADMVNALYGTSLDVKGMLSIGAECLKQEKEFNQRAGITEAHDRLPEFMYREPLPPHNAIFDITSEELHA